ncbi:sensor histidine kinase [Paenibacillus sp. R14(2021)]|uniref:sensor histidine kinase n=1 Tax=Paenibacillus sp. R14(2021) TaxID=2859228 RepID=UPI001C611992|nr:histidine kinase [Paenibacillus sp. R14(2021)]
MASIASQFAFRAMRAKLIIGVLLLTLPPIGMLIYNNLYAINVVRNQVADSYKNTTQMYMNQIDVKLDDIDKYMNNIVALNLEFITMAQTSSEDRYVMSKLLLYNSMFNDINMYPSAYSFILYDKKRSDYLEINQGRGGYSVQEQIKDFVRGQAEQNRLQSEYRTYGWVVKPIDGDYFLIHTMKYDNLYLTATIKANDLMIPFSLLQTGDRGGALFTDPNGTAMTNPKLVETSGIELRSKPSDYYLSGKNHRFLIVGQPSRTSAFSLVVVIPDDKILQNLQVMQRIVSLFPIIACMILPVGLFFLRKTILLPLNRLLAAMKRIRGGILETRIESAPNTNEFQLVNETFNQMVDQIRELKINVYEEQISKQKEELLRLQLQMNPHFFMNSLSVLYHLAKVNKTDLMMEMTLCLIQHFRFMFRSNLTFVLLKDELEHARNYLRIQELRFPGSISCEIQVPDFLLEVPVPPLILQTFIENTVKHAVTLEEPILITACVDVADSETVPSLAIHIEDTGKGYPSHVLREINKGNSIVNEKGEHTGIWNVQRRIRLLYGKDGNIRFGNRTPHGAVVNIIVPMEPDRRQGGEAVV